MASTPLSTRERSCNRSVKRREVARTKKVIVLGSSIWCCLAEVLRETESLGLGQSLYVCVFVSAFGLSEQSADPANQSLDEGVAGADLAVQTLHLQQLPLQSLSETCPHVALQLHTHRRQRDQG